MPMAVTSMAASSAMVNDALQQKVWFITEALRTGLVKLDTRKYDKRGQFSSAEIRVLPRPRLHQR